MKEYDEVKLVPGKVKMTLLAGFEDIEVQLDLMEIDNTESVERPICRYGADVDGHWVEVTIPMDWVSYTAWSKRTQI